MFQSVPGISARVSGSLCIFTPLTLGSEKFLFSIYPPQRYCEIQQGGQNNFSQLLILFLRHREPIVSRKLFPYEHLLSVCPG